LTAARLPVRCVGCGMDGWAYILPNDWRSSVGDELLNDKGADRRGP